MNEDFKSIKDLMKTTKAVAAPADKDEFFKTGFSAIDEHIPLKNGSLTIIAGVHNIGKTALALNIINNVSLKNNIPSTILTDKYSYEIIEDLVSIHYETYFNALKGTIIDKIEMIEGAPVYLGEPQKHDFKNLMESIYFLGGEKKAGLIVIDDINILGEPHKEYGYSGKIGQLRVLAEKLNIVILLLVSLPSEIMRYDIRTDYRPTINDLGETVDADLISCDIWFLHRDSYYYCTDDKSAEIILETFRYWQDTFDNDVIRTAVKLDYNEDCFKYSDLK